jgi:hypothetical protein
MPGFSENQGSKSSSVIGGRNSEIDGEPQNLTKPPNLGGPATIADVVGPETDRDHTLSWSASVDVKG